MVWSLIGVLLLVGAFAGYKGFKRWRATSLSQSALVLAEDPQRWSEAISRAQAAYALQPGDLEIIRTVARLLEMQNPEAAVDFWIQAGVHSNQDPEDRVALLRCYNRMKQYRESAALIKDLDASGFRSAGYLTAKAQYLAGNHRYEEALACVESILQLDDASPDAPFIYYRTVLLVGDEAARSKAEALLWKIAREDRARAPEAIRNLLNSGASVIGRIAELETLAETQLKDTRNERLLLWHLQLHLRTKPQEEVVPLILREFNINDVEDKLALLRVLFDEGLYSELVSQVTETEALKRKDYCLLYFDSLMELNRMNELGTLLERDRLPLEEYLRVYYLARVARQLGNYRQANLLWEQALGYARNDPEQLWFLVQAAGKLGLTGQARTALERLSALPTTKRIAYQLLISSAYAQGSSSELLESLLKLREEYPQDPAVLNDLIYVKLLRNDALSERLPEAEQLCVANPLMLSHRITYALALLRNGLPAEAMQVIDATKIDWSLAQERFRVVAASVLTANGRTSEADELTHDISLKGLLPEELALLKQARMSAP
ncbi:MAG: hypothetical protein SFY80_00310 [Verrucomicrobiota bacterium]|nr:hypothetical protein [Verrucomicrobiota bacterium]